MSKTKSDLVSLTESYKEALEYWYQCLDPTKPTINQIKSAKVSNPIDELIKLTNLIKAHSTKVGIIFKPETLKNQYDVAHSTLGKLSESIVLIMSIIPQLKSQDLSKIFYEEIINNLRLLINANIGLSKELYALSKDDIEATSEENTNGSDNRLVSIGQIWSNCDLTITLLQNGKIAFLTSKIKVGISLIVDGLDEFEEWIENPDDFDNDDPFGLNDEDFSDEEEDDEREPPISSKDELSDDEDNSINNEKLVEFAKKSLQKFKLIKLLLTSLNKSLPSNVSGEKLDNIYDLQKKLVNCIDKLILDLMLDQQVDEVTKEFSEEIDKTCKKIIKILNEVNKSDELKVKWVNTWSIKYEELKTNIK